MAKKAPRKHRLPASKEALLRRHVKTGQSAQPDMFELYLAIVDSIRSELYDLDPAGNNYEKLSRPRQVVVLIDNWEGEVRNGGFQQYYGNPSGAGAALLPAALKEVGATQEAKLVSSCNAVFGRAVPREYGKREDKMDQLGAAARRVWSKADKKFLAIDYELWYVGLDKVVPYILQHAEEFFAAKSKPKR